MLHQWPAPARLPRRVFRAFAAIITLPFLAGSPACYRHDNAAEDVASARPPPPSAAAALLADKATPLISPTVTVRATPSPAAATASATPAVSPPPAGPAAAGNSEPSPAPAPVLTPTPVPIPHFASAEANDYVRVYEAYIQNFRTAYIRMMKDADLSEYSRLIVQAQELHARGERIEEDLDPNEREALGKYLDAKAEEVRRITSEAL